MSAVRIFPQTQKILVRGLRLRELSPARRGARLAAARRRATEGRGRRGCHQRDSRSDL